MTKKELLTLMQKCEVLINIHLHKSLRVYSEAFLSQAHSTIVISLKDVLDPPEFIRIYQTR